MPRIITSSVLMCLLSACAHSAAKPCPAVSDQASAQHPATDLKQLAWLDESSLDEAKGPLALFDVRWLILTGDSGAYASVPGTLHNFTLGRWECALSGEKTGDTLEQGKAVLDRKRRLVCTHPTGVVAQSELSCGWRTPSPVRDGSPARGRREMHLSLSDAPTVSVSCEPEATRRLPLYHGERERTAEACVVAGHVQACSTSP